jgi:organic radical activating enzyme
MKMAGFYDESISNGLGWRAVLFVSGCPHNCPGCHNKIAQDYNYGEEFDEDKIIARIKENSILNGITISGGEPLCKENIARILKVGGVCLCFGWNTNGIGKSRGFEMTDILIVAHGGSKNDTLCTKEVKKP